MNYCDGSVKIFLYYNQTFYLHCTPTDVTCTQTGCSYGLFKREFRAVASTYVYVNAVSENVLKILNELVLISFKIVLQNLPTERG
jgi:hypothetical protein